MVAPLHTCEAVLTEAEHLLRRESQPATALMELIETGALAVTFSVADGIPELKQFLRRYSDWPMSLADACLVRMSEARDRCRIMTTDSHFRIYRRHGRKVIPLLMPPQERSR